MDQIPRDGVHGNFDIIDDSDGRKAVRIEIEGRYYSYTTNDLDDLLKALTALIVNGHTSLLTSPVNEDVSKEMEIIERDNKFPEGIIGILSLVHSKFKYIDTTMTFIKNGLNALSEINEGKY